MVEGDATGTKLEDLGVIQDALVHPVADKASERDEAVQVRGEPFGQQRDQGKGTGGPGEGSDHPKHGKGGLDVEKDGCSEIRCVECIGALAKDVEGYNIEGESSIGKEHVHRPAMVIAEPLYQLLDLFR